MRGLSDGEPLRPRTWPGGGPKPLGAMPRGEAAGTEWEGGLRDKSGGCLAPHVFLQRCGTPELDRRKAASESDTRSLPAAAATRAAMLSAPGASARCREVGGGGTPEPGLTPGGRPTSEAAQGRATVTQRARGRQSGRRGAARPTSQRGGRRSSGGRGAAGAGRAGDSGRKPPVSISARSCGGGAGS